MQRSYRFARKNKELKEVFKTQADPLTADDDDEGSYSEFPTWTNRELYGK